MSHSFARFTLGSKRFLCLFVFCLGCGFALPAVAQTAPPPAAGAHTRGDLTGSWQGTLQAGKPLRFIVTFTKADKGFTGKAYSIDQSPQGFMVSDISVDGSTVKFAVSVMTGTFTGTLNADGSTMAGTLNLGPSSFPFTLVRATKETAWRCPDPRWPPS